MMPLLLANIGDEVIVKLIKGKPEIKKHLENLGFVSGSKITVINKIGSNLIVVVKETRVAISQEMAGKIMV